MKSGASSAAGLDGHNFARSGDVVLVSLNHRLNLFGHLSLAESGDKRGRATTKHRRTTTLGVGIWELGVNAIIVLFASAIAFAQGPTYRFGSTPSAEEIKARDTAVSPAGKQLPPGVIEQAMPRVQFTDQPLEDTLATMAQWAYDLRIVNRKPNLAGLIDTTILGKARAAASRE